MDKSLSFIREGLEEAAVNNKLAIKAEMLSDEMIAAMLPHATGDHLDIRIRRFLGDTVINISMKGEGFDLFEYAGDAEETDDYEKEEVIRSILLRAYGEDLKYSHKKGVNRVTIKAGGTNRAMMKSTIIAMLVVYGLLITVVGRLNPIRFFSKIKVSMGTSLVLMSSSAAMPTNLKTCTEKLGISPKVANFSIPLGATVNMDRYNS